MIEHNNEVMMNHAEPEEVLLHQEENAVIHQQQEGNAVVQEQMNEAVQVHNQNVVNQMPVDAEIRYPAPTHIESRGTARKMLRKSSKSRREYLKQNDDRNAKRERRNMRRYAIERGMVDELEKISLKERLSAINEEEKRKIQQAKEEGGMQVEQNLKFIRWRAQQNRVDVMDRYAKSLHPYENQDEEGVLRIRKKRAEAFKKKEEMALEADHLRRIYRVSTIENVKEREREESTLKRHAFYDWVKKMRKDDNPLAREEAEWIHPVTGHRLVNVGRAFFGGTKPMYIFEDRDSENHQQYLFKEAVNCLGSDKPEGALVTEAAANLQHYISGEYAIPAFTAKKDGKVLGSFQLKLDTWQQEEGKLDLFSWQAHPNDFQLPENVKDEILREHTLDWLLCNFDTKGENFLQRADGHFSSFDKEASFGKLFDEGAQQMSTTYKPHANDTLYNVLFTEFAEGRVDLNLNSVMNQIHIVQGLSDEVYLAMFRDMLDQKYGREGSAKRTRAENAILARKNGLLEEYKRFFGELVRRRHEVLAREGRPDGYADRLDNQGGFIFFG